MTQEFDSGGLEQIDQSYGLAGAGSQTTQLADESISQTLPINEMNRRSRAPFQSGGSKGLMVARMRNVHTIAGELMSFIDPYNPVNPVSGFKSPFDPRAFDIWILGVSARTETNIAGPNVTWATFGFNMPTTLFSMSATNIGGPAPLAVQEELVIGWADWDTYDAAPGNAGAIGGGVGAFADNRPSGMYGHINRRISFGEEMRFRSQVTAAADLSCFVRMGIFPAAVGQDLGF